MFINIKIHVSRNSACFKAQISLYLLFFLLENVTMPTIVDTLTFMRAGQISCSAESSMIFLTSVPGLLYWKELTLSRADLLHKIFYQFLREEILKMTELLPLKMYPDHIRRTPPVYPKKSLQRRKICSNNTTLI